MMTRRSASIIIFVTTIIVVSGVFLLSQRSGGYDYSESIEGTLCYSTNGCPDGYRCYEFEDVNIEHPVCLKSDPCQICSSGQCTISNESPNRVICNE